MLLHRSQLEVEMEARKVSLFRNGRSQAVRIPKQFELPGKEATMTREGSRLIIEPVTRGSLIEYLETAEPIDEDWPWIDDPLPEPVEL